MTPGFPSAPSTALSALGWGGTAGWYLARSNADLYAQRFDASGAMLGTLITAPAGQVAGFVVRGDNLVLAYATQTPNMGPSRYELVSLNSAGTASAPVEIGVGISSSVGLANVGAILAASWRAPSGQHLAFVTP